MDDFLFSSQLSWTELKARASAKQLGFQYVENASQYWTYFTEAGVLLWAEIWKSGATLPKGVDPTQNATDRTDWEDNYKTGANGVAQVKVIATVVSESATTGFSSGNVTVAAGGTVNKVHKTAYTEQTTNFQGSIVSSSANDTSAGTGARQVKITYYDQTGAGPFTETVTLNGTTAVNLTNVDHCFIEKIEVVTVGTREGSNAGTITLKTDLAGGGTTVGTIGAGDNRTFWAQHYVPLNKTAKIHTLTIGSKNALASSWLQVTNPTVSTSPASDLTPEYRTAANTISLVVPFNVPVEVAGPAKITQVVRQDGNGSNSYFGSFDWEEE